jgi:hypothetical protein
MINFKPQGGSNMAPGNPPMGHLIQGLIPGQMAQKPQNPKSDVSPTFRNKFQLPTSYQPNIAKAKIVPNQAKILFPSQAPQNNPNRESYNNSQPMGNSHRIVQNKSNNYLSFPQPSPNIPTYDSLMPQGNPKNISVAVDLAQKIGQGNPTGGGHPVNINININNVQQYNTQYNMNYHNGEQGEGINGGNKNPSTRSSKIVNNFLD